MDVDVHYTYLEKEEWMVEHVYRINDGGFEWLVAKMPTLPDKYALKSQT